MKIILIAFASLIALNSSAQGKKVNLNLYISPSICKSPTQHRVFADGKVTLTNLTKSSGLFFGGGLEILKNLDKNWSIVGDLGFRSKGYFATMDSTFNSGSFGGTGFRRTDLNFLVITASIEKQLLVKNSDYKIIFSSGIFYGLHIPNIIGFGLEANGNDFGPSLSIGIQRKRSFAKLDFQKGFRNIQNNANSLFKTTILGIKIGYTILNLLRKNSR